MHDLLETLKNSVDFLFIQEAPIHFVRKVPSTMSEFGDDLIGPVTHRDWQCIDKRSAHPDSQVAIYVNKRLSSNFQFFPDLSPSIDPNVLVLCARHNTLRSNFFNLINIYNRPNTRHAAIESLLRIAPTLSNLAVVQGDFNLRSPLWDPSISTASGLAERLFTTFSDLELNLTNDDGDPTWSNNRGSLSVIDLVFCNDVLARVSPQLIIDLDGRGRSDHAVLFLAFGRQSPHWGKPYIARDSEEEASFLSDIAAALITNAQFPPEVACTNIATAIECSWATNSKLPRTDANPTSWWNDDCQAAKDHYALRRTRDNLRAYNAATRRARQEYFLHKIDQMTANNAPWEGIRWTRPRPPPKFSTITDNGAPIPDISTLFDVMHGHFSNAHTRNVSETFLDSIPQLETRSWPLISQTEVLDMIAKTSNTSAPGPDNVSWHHLKQISDVDGVLNSICTLFNNVCASGTWPSWFSESISVIIPKPKKTDYTIPKAYRPIALLNTVGKLLTKIIAHRLQFDAAAFSLLHEGQCGGVQKHATIDAGLSLLDFINTNRERGWHVSVCAIDVAQFFPSINHHAAKRILMKLGFSHTLTNLIASYFTGRTTLYRWDSAMSKPYDFNLGTPQGDCLSPILSALFLSVAIKHVFPHSSPPRSSRCLFFVDDGALFTASPSLAKNVRVLSNLLIQLLTTLDAIGLAIEPSKTELIHFFAFQMTASSRSLAVVNQPPLVFHWGGTTYEIKPCKVWRYLGFFFTPSLDWTYHVQYYANKGFSSIRACGMLGNSLRGIGPKQRSLAYQSCVLSILQYGSALWYAPGGTGVIKYVKRMERVHSFALGWITGSFRTTPIGARGLIAGIPPLRILLDLRFQGLRARLATLDDYHIARIAWSQRWIDPKIRKVRPRTRPRHLPPDNPMTRLATDEIREQFSPHHPLSRPGDRVIDKFPNFISIDAYSPKKGSSLFKAWLSDLTATIQKLHSSGRPVLYTDGAYWNTSSKGSFSFTCFHRGIWTDIYDWCPAGSSFDSEIAAIESAIQWVCIRGLRDPIMFIDNKAALTSFLDTRIRSSHMATIRINAILAEYLTTRPTHFTFQYCPSHSGVEGNERADRLTKLGAAIAPIVPPRILISNFISDHIRRMNLHWRVLAASRSFRGHQWLPIRRKKKTFRPAIRNKAATNFFYVLSGNDIVTLSRMARAITNHAPTGEYRLRFYPELDNQCPTCPGRLMSQSHILFSCPRYVPLASSLTNWRRDRHNDKSWKTYFTHNVSAFTFGDLPDDVH
ncbi:hypothetical protein AX14_001266 [Amanita brunnescens Koide BX004]|nr:hypothetical protein AX14_001266 [Amanita brunnescens Koide BX004]